MDADATTFDVKYFKRIDVQTSRHFVSHGIGLKRGLSFFPNESSEESGEKVINHLTNLSYAIRFLAATGNSF